MKKPLYGLNDASRKFWLKVKKLFAEIGLKRLEGCIAVYFMLNKEGNLDGIVSTCVDYLDIVGSTSFVELITDKVSAVLDISKVEDDKFRFTGIDIRKMEDGIEISMDDYADSLEKIRDKKR